MPDPEELLRSIASITAHLGEAARASSSRPAPAGEWSVNAILGHMIWTETEVWHARLRRVANEHGPRFEWVDQEGIDLNATFNPRPLDTLLGEFAAARGETLAHLRGLTEDGWARYGIHARFGQMDVTRLCEEMLKHDREHVDELRLRIP